jgi:hypothetical protein
MLEDEIIIEIKMPTRGSGKMGVITEKEWAHQIHVPLQ